MFIFFLGSKHALLHLVLIFITYDIYKRPNSANDYFSNLDDHLSLLLGGGGGLPQLEGFKEG